MENWRLAYLGMRRMPRDLSEFELATFFTFSPKERALITARRGPLCRFALALHIGFVRMTGATLDGVYLLPASDTADGEMAAMCESIGQAGGTGYLMRLTGRGTQENLEFQSLFDRADDYAMLRRSLDDPRKTLSELAPIDIAKLLRRTRREFEAISAIDFFPNEASVRAQSAWQDFAAAAEAVLSPDEPHQMEGTIKCLERDKYQGRVRATRCGGRRIRGCDGGDNTTRSGRRVVSGNKPLPRFFARSFRGSGNGGN